MLTRLLARLRAWWTPPTWIGYDDVPLQVRVLLDEVYTVRGVEVWWNARNRALRGERARDVWITVEGRREVLAVVHRLVDGAW